MRGLGNRSKSQKTVFRAKAETTSTKNRLTEAARMPKEGAVGKKARVGASRPFQAIHAPLKRESQKRFGRATRKSADATNNPLSFSSGRGFYVSYDPGQPEGVTQDH